MARHQGAYSTSRRSFCWMLASVLVAPGIAIAQASKVRRIGTLDIGRPDTHEDLRKEAEPCERLDGWRARTCMSSVVTPTDESKPCNLLPKNCCVRRSKSS